jgi:hypothetical protein
VQAETATLDADSDLGAYRLVQELTPAASLVCCDVSGNIVVLKKLEEDCLHRNQLHPAIKQRLARVREIAHPRIASLRTVERWQADAWLVWTFLDGQTWEETLDLAAQDARSKVDRSQRDRQLRSSLAATVAALHENGIVHGNLHGRNVIVRPDGQVWLTHISPYLYTDPQADLDALATMLADDTADFVELQAGRITLRDFSYRLLQTKRSAAGADDPPEVASSNYRRLSLLQAAVVLVVSLLIAVLTYQTVSKSAIALPPAGHARTTEARQH